MALTSQVQTLTTKVTELSTQTAAAAVGAAGQTGVPTYTRITPVTVSGAPPPDFTIGKTNIIDAWRMWHGGNQRCGAESNKTVCAYKDIPWSHLDGETFKKTRREGACGAKLWGTSRRSSTRPPAPHTRCGAATHHRTIMMLVTLIPKGSSGTRTSQPRLV